MKNLGYFLWSLVFLSLPFPLPAQSDDLAAKTRRTKELMEAGRIEEAIPLCSDLVRAEPNNPDLLTNLGLALHMAGYERKAIAQFEAALKLRPSHMPARLFLGEAYLTLGEPNKAIEVLESVTRAQPGNPDAPEMLAEAFSSLGRLEDASEQYLKLTQLAGENPRAWDGLRRAYDALAHRAFEELKNAAPESAYFLVLIAESRVTYDSAFTLYRQALARMPKLRGVHKAVAEIYRKTGRPDWAAIEEEKERTLPPLNCSNLMPSASTPGSHRDEVGAGLRLECDFLAGRYQEVVALAKSVKTPESSYWQARAFNALALGAFSRLTQMKPSAQLHQVMAKVYLDRRLYLQSVKEWQEALKFSPADPRIQKGLAVALSLGGEFQAAQTILEDLLKREPDSAGLNYLLGDNLLNSGQALEAISRLKKAVELDPGLLSAQKSLARAYLRIGKGEQAIPHLKAALPVDEDGSLYYQLARAYQTSGQQELAEEMLRKFRQIQNSASLEEKTLNQKTEITPP